MIRGNKLPFFRSEAKREANDADSLTLSMKVSSWFDFFDISTIIVVFEQFISIVVLLNFSVYDGFLPYLLGLVSKC